MPNKKSEQLTIDKVSDRAQYNYLRSYQRVGKYCELLAGDEKNLPEGWTYQMIGGWISAEVTNMNRVGSILVTDYRINNEGKIV